MHEWMIKTLEVRLTDQIWTSERTNGRVHEQTNKDKGKSEQTNKRTNEQTNKRTNEQTNKRTNERNRRLYRWATDFNLVPNLVDGNYRARRLLWIPWIHSSKSHWFHSRAYSCVLVKGCFENCSCLRAKIYQK